MTQVDEKGLEPGTIERHDFGSKAGDPDWCYSCGEHRNHPAHAESQRPYPFTLLDLDIARIIDPSSFLPGADEQGQNLAIAKAKRITKAATALAAKDAELERRDMQLEASAKVALDLSAQLAEARKALEPFANVAEHDIGDDEDDSDTFWPMSNARYSMAGRLRVGHLRAARRALAGGRDG